MGKHLSVIILKHRLEVSSFIMLALLIIGMYLPSSVNGNIVLGLPRAAQLLLVMLFFLLFLFNGLSSPLLIIFSLAVPLILVLATLISPLSDIAPGVVIYYVPFAVMLSLNLRRVRWTRFLTFCFIVVNIINLTCNLLVIVDFKVAELFLINWYSSIQPGTLYSMLQNNKPVSTFTLYSVASVMYFIFFVCNVCAFQSRKRFIYLIFALGYFVSCFFLYSNTAFFIIIFMSIFALYKLIPRTNKALVYFLAVILTLIVVCSVFLTIYIEPISDIFHQNIEKVEQKVTSRVNGLYGRYNDEGGQSKNIQYAVDHPHMPAGFRKNKDINYRDSGIVEYFVRGSFGLLIVMYFGFFLFLFVNLRSKSTALFLFLVIVAAESGFSYMCYPRFQYLLPCMIVFLNSLEPPSVPLPN